MLKTVAAWLSLFYVDYITSGAHANAPANTSAMRPKAKLQNQVTTHANTTCPTNDWTLCGLTGCGCRALTQTTWSAQSRYSDALGL